MNMKGFFIFLLFSICSSSGYATVNITVSEIGSDVVAEATGTLDLTGASVTTPGSNVGGGMIPNLAYLVLGPGSFPFGKTTATSGAPPTFGSGGFTGPSSHVGDSIGFYGSEIRFDAAFTGGSISATTTWSSTDFATLGLSKTSFTLTLPNDSINVSVIPEPESVALFLGLAAILGIISRKKFHKA